jgi:hypothetical protein
MLNAPVNMFPACILWHFGASSSALFCPSCPFLASQGSVLRLPSSERSNILSKPLTIVNAFYMPFHL